MSAPHGPLPSAEKLRVEKLGILPILFPALGVIGLVSTFAWGWATNHAQLAFSYLFAFAVGFTLCAGSLFRTLLHHALDADWSVLMRRILETVASCFPVILVLALPLLLLFPKELWHWMTADTAHDPPPPPPPAITKKSAVNARLNVTVSLVVLVAVTE